MTFPDKLRTFILSQAGPVDISEEFCQNKINIGSHHVPPCYRNLGNSSYCTLKKRSIFNSIDLSRIPVNKGTNSRLGWTKYSNCMKLSTRASSSFLYVCSLERNAGKVYLVCLFNLYSLLKMFPKNHFTASINLFLVTFLIVALDIGELFN